MKDTIYCCEHCDNTSFENTPTLCSKCFGYMKPYYLYEKEDQPTGLEILEYFVWKNLGYISLGIVTLVSLYIISR